MHNPITLLIPEKADIEFEQLLAAWTNKGGLIKRLGRMLKKRSKFLTLQDCMQALYLIFSVALQGSAATNSQLK